MTKDERTMLVNAGFVARGYKWVAPIIDNIGMVEVYTMAGFVVDAVYPDETRRVGVYGTIDDVLAAIQKSRLRWSNTA